MSDTPKPARAPAIAAKLEAAREVLQELEQDVGQFVLDASDGVSGAAKRLADLRSTIAAAQRDVGELEQAHALAVKLDRKADAVAAAEMRAAQFSVFSDRMSDRETAVVDLVDAVDKMNKAFSAYMIATSQALAVKPVGTAVSMIGMGRNNNLGPALGDLKHLIAFELVRHSKLAPTGERFVLPLVPVEDWQVANMQAEIEPALQVFRESNATILHDIKAQMDRLDASHMFAAMTEVAA